jgi:peroxiredoxin
VTDQADSTGTDRGSTTSPAERDAGQSHFAQSADFIRAPTPQAAIGGKLTATLRGRTLPDIFLPTLQRVNARLLSQIEGVAVVYLIPGDGQLDQPETFSSDIAQHRGYVNQLSGFTARQVSVVSVTSAPLAYLDRIRTALEVGHFMFSDPDLQIAAALGLPVLRDGITRRYPRMTLITKDGRITQVFYPISDGEAAGNARQVMAWLVRAQTSNRRSRR